MKELQTTTQGGRAIDIFSSPSAFAQAKEIAEFLSTSALIPKQFKGEENIGSLMIAMDLAGRMRLPVLMVAQNIDVIYGRPTWRSKFTIGRINTSGNFTPLRFVYNDDATPQDVTFTEYAWDRGANRNMPHERTVRGVLNKSCYAVATEKATGMELKGPVVDVVMAIRERWYYRDGSKWPTMPQLMLMYRAASMWGSVYAPELTMGLVTEDEARDIIDVTPDVIRDTDSQPAAVTPIDTLNDSVKSAAAPRQAEQTSGDVAEEDNTTPPDISPAPTPSSYPITADGVLWDKRKIPHMPSVHALSCKTDDTWRRKKGVSQQAMTEAEEKYLLSLKEEDDESEEARGEASEEKSTDESSQVATLSTAKAMINAAQTADDLDVAEDFIQDAGFPDTIVAALEADIAAKRDDMMGEDF